VVVFLRIVFDSSTPYAWGSTLMIDSIKNQLVSKGIALPYSTPLFVYSRIISLWEQSAGLSEVVELVVASRMAVSNVGLGGVLFKWDPAYSAHPELSIQVFFSLVLFVGCVLILSHSEE
jgi:hypothetical protein